MTISFQVRNSSGAKITAEQKENAAWCKLYIPKIAILRNYFHKFYNGGCPYYVNISRSFRPIQGSTVFLRFWHFGVSEYRYKRLEWSAFTDDLDDKMTSSKPSYRRCKERYVKQPVIVREVCYEDVGLNDSLVDEKKTLEVYREDLNVKREQNALVKNLERVSADQQLKLRGIEKKFWPLYNRKCKVCSRVSRYSLCKECYTEVNSSEDSNGEQVVKPIPEEQKILKTSSIGSGSLIVKKTVDGVQTTRQNGGSFIEAEKPLQRKVVFGSDLEPTTGGIRGKKYQTVKTADRTYSVVTLGNDAEADFSNLQRRGAFIGKSSRGQKATMDAEDYNMNPWDE